MSEAETRRRLMLRRQALVVLRAVQGAGYDGWLSERALYRTLRAEADDLAQAEVRECLAYLADRGYAQRRAGGPVAMLPGASKPSARITSAGVDLLDGTVAADPGVAP